MRSPIWYFGGKGKMVKNLLPLIPPHKIYVEVFGGGASLLFAKKPSPVEVYNDIDSDLVNFFRVLRDPEKFEQFYRKAVLTPYSREEYCFCRETFQECQDDIERAYRFFVTARMSFSGRILHGWSFTVTDSSRGMAGAVSKWLSCLDGLPDIHERLMRVQIEHDDFRKIIPRYDTADTFFYLDPPYVPDTRRSGEYAHEMTLDDHRELVEMLLAIKGKAMLSGYRHEVYEPLERAGWQRIDYETACHAVGRTRGTGILGEGAARAKQPRVESVWLSPNAQAQRASHDKTQTLFELDKASCDDI
jgi:DNA adenine methylase